MTYFWRINIAVLLSLYLMLGCLHRSDPYVPADNPTSAVLRITAHPPEFGTKYRISSTISYTGSGNTQADKRRMPNVAGKRLPPILKRTKYEPVQPSASTCVTMFGRVFDRDDISIHEFRHEVTFDTRAGYWYDIEIAMHDLNPGQEYSVVVYEKNMPSDSASRKEILVNMGFPFNTLELAPLGPRYYPMDALERSKGF